MSAVRANNGRSFFFIIFLERELAYVDSFPLAIACWVQKKIDTRSTFLCLCYSVDYQSRGVGGWPWVGRDKVRAGTLYLLPSYGRLFILATRRDLWNWLQDKGKPKGTKENCGCIIRNRLGFQWCLRLAERTLSTCGATNALPRFKEVVDREERNAETRCWAISLRGTLCESCCGVKDLNGSGPRCYVCFCVWLLLCLFLVGVPTVCVKCS